MSDVRGPDVSAVRYVVLGVAALAVMLAGIGLWSTRSTLSGAIVAPGTLEVAARRQVVQHAGGGTVREVLVENGSRVAAGDVLIRLDTQAMRGELAYLEETGFELAARRARLRALAEGAEGVDFGVALPAESESRRAILAGQRALFTSERATLRGQIGAMRQRQAQITAQLLGHNAQLRALSDQLALIADAEARQETLLKKGLSQAAALLNLRRERSALEGRLAEIMAARTLARESHTEIGIDIERLDAERRERALTRARETETALRDTRNAIRKLHEAMAAAEIRAPIAGQVYGLQAQAPQTVLGPAQPVLTLMPEGRPALVRTRVAPSDIELVHAGQPVKMRLSALDQKTTPEIEGRIARIAAEAEEDERTGARYFEVEVRLSDSALEALPDRAALIHGMPVETFIQTGTHAPIVYLVKPVADYFARAFRES